MGTAFAVPANNIVSIVGPGGYTAGSGSLALAAGQGALYPALTGDQFYRITVVQAAYAYSPAATTSNLTIFRASSLTADTFGTVLAIEGTTDRNYAAGDTVDVRVTAGTIGDIQTAINSHDALSPLATSSVSITTNTVLTDSAFGRNHVCTGTTGNYTVTLPAVSGNEGKFIWFMMSSALTKLVTIARNSSDLIDGSTSHVMWAKETACLYCDGSNWVKVAGKTIPMSCSMYRNASGFVIPGTGVMTKIPLDAVTSDPTGQMADTVNGQALIMRTGTYHTVSQIYLAMGGSPSSYILAQVEKSAVQEILANVNSAGSGTAQPISVIGVSSCIPGNGFTFSAQQGSGVNATVANGAAATFLSVYELVTW